MLRSKQETGIDISPLIYGLHSAHLLHGHHYLCEDEARAGATERGRGLRASSKSIRVYLDRAAVVYIDEVPVRPWMIQSRVRDLLRSASDKQVLVITDRAVLVEKLINVVDQCCLAEHLKLR